MKQRIAKAIPNLDALFIITITTVLVSFQHLIKITVFFYLVTIQSTNNQISYQVRHHDLDPFSNCGDSLTVNGAQFCGYQSSANNEAQTMEYEINVHWFSDSIPNYEYEGFSLWVWEENPNESRSIAAESTMTKALDPKVRPSKEERDEIRKANLNPTGEFIRY